MRTFNLKAEGTAIVNADFISPRKIMLMLNDGIDPTFATECAEMANFGSEIYMIVKRLRQEYGTTLERLPLNELFALLQKMEALFRKSSYTIFEAERSTK